MKPCRQKVLDFVPTDETVFIYNINEFDGMMLKRLCNALSFWHQTLLVSLSHVSDHTTSIWSHRHLLVKIEKPLNRITSYCIYNFSAILTKIISKCILLLIVALGLMLPAWLIVPPLSFANCPISHIFLLIPMESFQVSLCYPAPHLSSQDKWMRNLLTVRK